MSIPNFADVRVGDALPGVAMGPITRHTLGVYAGTSGDYNPLHIDPDYARESGMPDVFAHGMLSAAYLAHVLTRWVPQAAIRELSVRFVAITRLGDEVRCDATVTDKFIHHGEPRVALALTARNQADEVKLTGTAVVSLASRTPL